ncbi:hypothetical protein [Helicobacter cetorum]|uniref:hypothetical protein n=1 Tax=Helicobacter cetorum TaxID=138563 RepID=UPI000CF1033D|nr:hypothetical protein [Helicobacter cetorum]
MNDNNEKTPSELLEEQLKMQQSEQPQQEREPQEQELEKQAESKSAFLPTGLEYLDNKLKNKSLSMFDYYMAKKYLGLDLNVNLQGNLNIKNDTTLKNPAKPLEAINANMDTLDSAMRFLKSADTNAGIGYGVNKFLNKVSFGILPMTHAKSQMHMAENNLETNYAKTLAGGKPPAVYDKEQAKDIIGSKFRGQNELGSKISQLMQSVVENNLNVDSRLLALNGINPIEFKAKNFAYYNLFKTINNNKGRYDKKTLEKTYNKAYSQYLQNEYLKNAK